MAEFVVGEAVLVDEVVAARELVCGEVGRAAEAGAAAEGHACVHHGHDDPASAGAVAGPDVGVSILPPPLGPSIWRRTAR